METSAVGGFAALKSNRPYQVPTMGDPNDIDAVTNGNRKPVKSRVRVIYGFYPAKDHGISN